MNVSRLSAVEQDESRQQEEAATKIQAVFRGHQARKEMKEADHPDEPTREELEAEFPLDDKG